MHFTLSDYLEAFDVPDWISQNSAWIYHIPMVPIFLKLLRPRTFVELGTFRGDSYMSFCENVLKTRCETRCTAIDSWQGDPHAGFYGPQVYADLQRHHDPRYGNFSRLLRSDFDAALPAFPDQSIDLLHIDGLHTYDAVHHDFHAWQPKLSPRAVVLFHDTAVRDGDFGVWRLWEELAPAKPHFQVPYGFGLGILAHGPDVPPPFLTFLDELHAHHAQILPQLSALGRRNELMRISMLLTSKYVDCQEILNQWRTYTGQPLRNPTTDRSRAFQAPIEFAKATHHDLTDMAADATSLVKEILQLRKAAKPSP
jgi:hypothetical protein